MTETRTPINPLQFREVMGNYPTGVAIVTGVADDGSSVGMVVGTFTSVSLDPPLVAFLPATSSATFARLRTAESFCINVLAHDQVELCRIFSGAGEDKFSRVDWAPSPLGVPTLTGAVAHIHCAPQEVIDAGDHFIQLCQVDSLEVNRQVTPLLFFQGGYGGFSPRSMTAAGDSDLIVGVRLAALATPQIELLAASQRCEAAALVVVNDDELTTAATAYGGDAQMLERLGERLPLKPPMGEAYIAWAPDDIVERWLGNAVRDPELVQTYRRRLATLRDLGFAASQIQPEDSVRLNALIAEHRSPGLTPVRERALLAELAELTHSFHIGEFDTDRRYNIGALLVPVFYPDGDIAILLRLAQLPQDVPGSVVEGWIQEMRIAAEAVQAKLVDLSPPLEG
ncbi:flavin reductase family protein [Arthrobacter gengyunqii]|uniref:Flavin reductase family protein n=1 Tax=Arthrobacter gengyunqii TaxID=2886940 RepID=A0A9X1LYJ1_9MICC|nr:flavin reductase family protein [Arthrobacter gengyunqii]MCC3268073.1 flavin reductase family protein [Arthrobacter gengyunqii]UOY95491.1 flavin reductase family protein [Arthrobacter gengyunqii]